MSSVDLEGALRNEASMRSDVIPSIIAQRIEETLHGLPERKVLRKRTAVRRWSFSAAALVIVAVGMLSLASLYGPAVKTEIRKVPVIGSLFPKSETDPLQQVTDQGISFQIKDVIYDGRVIWIDYAIDSKQDLTGDTLEVGMKIDGISVERVVHDKVGYQSPIAVTGQQKNPRHYIGSFSSSLSAYRPSSFRLDLEVTRIGSKNGKWSITQDVSMTNRITIIKSGNQVANGLFQLELDQLRLSPLSSEVSYKIKANHQKQEMLMVGFEIVGDNGEIYAYVTGLMGAGASNVMQRSPFGAVGQGTRYLTVRPFVYTKLEELNFNKVTRVQMNKIPTEQEPIILPQGDAGQLLITKIEYFQDRTVVHFRTEGTNIIQQSEMLWVEFEDGSVPEYFGKSLPSINMKEQILEFAPVPADAKLFFVTRPVVPLTYDPDMEIRVDLPQ